eukprot:jgi/Chlat1/3932/Chrsp26S04202
MTAKRACLCSVATAFASCKATQQKIRSRTYREWLDVVVGQDKLWGRHLAACRMVSAAEMSSGSDALPPPSRYAAAKAWRTGRAWLCCSHNSNSINNCTTQLSDSTNHLLGKPLAMRLTDGGRRAVIVTARNGCHIADAATSRHRWTAFHLNDICATAGAISEDGAYVAYGTSTGVVSAFSLVADGKHLAWCNALGHVEAMAMLTRGHDRPPLVAAGTRDGFLSVACPATGAIIAGGWWVGRGGVVCACSARGGQCVAAGTGGGLIKMYDVNADMEIRHFIGSCDCPLAQVAEAEDLGVVLAAYKHNNSGNGHPNAAFAWDANSQVRVALLKCGTGRIGSGGTSAQVTALHADGYKVAATSGGAVTVFEARMWRPLFQLGLGAGRDEAAALHFLGPRLAVSLRSGQLIMLDFNVHPAEGATASLAPCCNLLRLSAQHTWI